MGRFFVLGFLALPIIEIAIFIKVGQIIGVLPTLALIIGGGLLGMAVLRMQGLAVLGQIRSNMQTNSMPGRTLFDAMLIGLAGVLLIIPGFLGDVFAIGLLLPPVRTAIFGWLGKRVRVVETTASYRRHADPSDPRLSDGAIDLDDDNYRPR